MKKKMDFRLSGSTAAIQNGGQRGHTIKYNDLKQGMNK